MIGYDSMIGLTFRTAELMVSTLLRGRVLSPFFRFCVFFLLLLGGGGGGGGDVNVLCDCKVLLHFHTYVMLRYC